VAVNTQPDLYEAENWGGQVSPHIHRWSPQLEWLSLKGEAAVDFVARMENLREGFPAICRRVGLPVQRLPHRNRRLHLHYSHYYDRTTRDLVGSYYARDIAAFGYDFEQHMLHLRLFISLTHNLRDAIPTEPVNPAALLPSLQLPSAPANTTRVTSYPSIARRRPPLQRRVVTICSALVISSICWLGTGFSRHVETERAYRDDASVPPPLASLIMPRPGLRAEFPYRPGIVNSIARMLPPASIALWHIWPGTLPGDSLIAEPQQPTARFASMPPPRPTSGYSASGTNGTPSHQWLVRHRQDMFW
jgi:hypothetical protein